MNKTLAEIAKEIEEMIPTADKVVLSPALNAVHDDYRWGALDPNLYYQWLVAAVRWYKPRHILELGTYRGISALSMYGAKPKEGLLTTVDLEIPTDYMVPNFVQTDSKFKAIIGDDLSDTVKGLIPKRPVDFFFIDTVHVASQIEAEWTFYRDVLAKGCMVVFDDFPGDRVFGGGLEKYERYDLSKYHGQGFSFFIYEPK